MKRIITMLFLILSISAYAQEEVPLITENVSIDASSATVIRSNKTPDTVEISFLLPMNETVCEKHETRFVVRASASPCG